MHRRLAVFICVVFSMMTLAGGVAFADHPPKKMMRNFKAFAQFGETGQLGFFAVNVARFGSLPDQPTTSGPNEGYSTFLADKFNLASAVRASAHAVRRSRSHASGKYSC